MEKQILETRVISTQFTFALEHDINKNLKEGYQIHGEMIVTPFKRGNNQEFLYTQIMAKYKE